MLISLQYTQCDLKGNRCKFRVLGVPLKFKFFWILIFLIFEIFDTMSTGRVNQNEILWVFSMAMTGTVQEKLQWLFKLYDKVDTYSMYVFGFNPILVRGKA